MKILPFILVVIAGIAGLYFSKSPDQGINPILGDESYVAFYGKEVPPGITEQERIRIHLAYVEYQLRRKPIDHLNKSLQEKRATALELLHEYWQKGEFPSNYDYANERKPCFRDKMNRICAVGFLVQQTGNEELVKSIEANENYSTIHEMKNSKLLAWVAQSGLTLEECAMIQPTYGAPAQSNPNFIPPGYAISSSVIGGIGLSSSLISLINLNTPSKNQWIMPSIGIASGISQITLGAVNYNRVFFYSPWNSYPSVHKRHQNLSLFNMGFGTFSTILNSYALIRGLCGKETRSDLSWNVFGYQNTGNSTTVGFNLVKHF